MINRRVKIANDPTSKKEKEKKKIKKNLIGNAMEEG